MFYGAAMDLICIFSELSEPKSLNYAFRRHTPRCGVCPLDVIPETNPNPLAKHTAVRAFESPRLFQILTPQTKFERLSLPRPRSASGAPICAAPPPRALRVYSRAYKVSVRVALAHPRDGRSNFTPALHRVPHPHQMSHREFQCRDFGIKATEFAKPMHVAPHTHTLLPSPLEPPYNGWRAIFLWRPPRTTTLDRGLVLPRYLLCMVSGERSSSRYYLILWTCSKTFC